MREKKKFHRRIVVVDVVYVCPSSVDESLV